MNINFIDNKNKFFTFSISIVVLILIFTVVNGINLDIQFQGGCIFTYSYEGELNKERLESKIEKTLDKKVSVQKITDMGTGLNKIIVSFGSDKSVGEALKNKLQNLMDDEFKENNIRMIQINNVNPTIGKEFFVKCMVAVVAAAVMMVIYIAIRFRRIGGWSAGVMAVVALIHDVIMIYGTFIILKMPISDNFIAGALMILGYSINDTIIIYDRIRENRKIYGSKLSFKDLVNKSINQSFARTINTTITTVISILVILIVAYLFNVNSIVAFMLPLMVGMIAGSYSTICIAGPLWVVWKERKRAAVD